MNSRDRFQEAAGYIVIFVIGSFVISATTRNPLWAIIAVVSALVVYAVSRRR